MKLLKNILANLINVPKKKINILSYNDSAILEWMYEGTIV